MTMSCRPQISSNIDNINDVNKTQTNSLDSRHTDSEAVINTVKQSSSCFCSFVIILLFPNLYLLWFLVHFLFLFNSDGICTRYIASIYMLKSVACALKALTFRQIHLTSDNYCTSIYGQSLGILYPMSPFAWELSR